MTQLAVESQKLNPSGLISLFTLDATSVGGSILYFTKGSEAGEPVMFGGIAYHPVGIELRGLQTSGIGSLPRPELHIANTDGLIQAIVNTWGDLNGCKLYRKRTFTRFLDGQPDADSSAFYGPDEFVFDRKASDTPEMISWELSASFDQEGVYIGRTIIRDTCLWRYRRWNPVAGDFDYSKAQCPYTGTQYFDVNDQPVAQASKDVPSRRLGCCEARFGKGNPLPFGGFPGVPRVR